MGLSLAFFARFGALSGLGGFLLSWLGGLIIEFGVQGSSRHAVRVLKSVGKV